VHVRVAVDVAADLVGQVDAALGDVVVAAGRPGGDVLEAAADGAAAVPAWDSRLRMPLQHVGGGRLPPICTNGRHGISVLYTVLHDIAASRTWWGPYDSCRLAVSDHRVARKRLDSRVCTRSGMYAWVFLYRG
jgi:hypothetical protein